MPRYQQIVGPTVAAVVVGRLTPDGTAEGQHGDEAATRSRHDPVLPRLGRRPGGELEVFRDELAEVLQSGWNGFNGRVVKADPLSPVGTPKAYLMRPFDSRLTYRSKNWLTLRLEVGHDEIDVTVTPELVIAAGGEEAQSSQ